MFTGIIQKIGTVKRVSRGAGLVVEIGFEPPDRRSLGEGGWTRPLEEGESIAVNGVSLTISAIGDDWIGVDLIPTTAAETILGAKKVGDKVNLEGDIVGKYIAKNSAKTGGLTEEALVRAGFV